MNNQTILAPTHYMFVAVETQLALELPGIVAKNALVLENRLHPHCIKTGRVNRGFFFFPKPATQRFRQTFRQEGLAVSQFAALIAGPNQQANGRQQGKHKEPSLPVTKTPAGEAPPRE